MANYVRCVRGAATRSGTPASPRFTLNSADDSAHDVRTGLTWQRAASEALSWTAAQTQCSAPWRLPAMKELLTLIDPLRINVASDPTFPAVSAPLEFWSSSLLDSGASWYVQLTAGYSGLNHPATPYRTRCVR
jgi:hypothetical protein